MEEKFLNKDYCLDKAKLIYNIKKLDMSVIDIAKELYAHAVLYYYGNKLKDNNNLKRYIIEHCERIDLEVGGDKPARKIVYNLIWLLIKLKTLIRLR